MGWEKRQKEDRPIGHSGSVFVRWEGFSVSKGINQKCASYQTALNTRAGTAKLLTCICQMGECRSRKVIEPALGARILLSRSILNLE